MSYPTSEEQIMETNTKQRAALIMTNSFTGTKGQRTEAADYDHDAMMSLWRDKLNCEIFQESGKDLSAQQMHSALKNFSNIQGEFDYVVVVISTHGGLVAKSFADHPAPILDAKDLKREQELGYEAYENYVEQADEGVYDKEPMSPVFFGNNFRPVREKEMKEMFYNDSATGLQNITKIFILNYCRGDTIDYGVIPTPPPPEPLMATMKSASTPAAGRDRDREIQTPSLMPLVSDAIAIYATHASTVAWQYKPDMGSWLICTIKNIFENAPGNKDLVEMLTEVNREMKTKTVKVKGRDGKKRNVKAMSVFESSLTKKVYL